MVLCLIFQNLFMKSISLSLILCCSLGIHSAIFAQSAGSTGSTKIFSLEECLNIAEKSNFDMQSAQAQIYAAEADSKAALGGYLPTVNANLGYARRLNQLGGGQFNVGGFRAPADQYSASASAGIILFNGFAREANSDRANANLNAAQQNIRQTSQQIRLNVWQQYITVLRNAQIVKTRKENLELGKNELQRVQARFDAGITPIGNVYAQEADMGNRELDLVQAENQFNLSKASLLTTMAMNPTEKAEFSEKSLPQEVNEQALAEFRSKVASLEETYKKAIESRHDIAAANSRLDAARYTVNGSRSGYIPTISASGGWSWANSEIKDFDLFARTFVGLNVDIPIFDAFRTNLQIQNAELQVKQREIERQRLELTIKSQLQSGVLNLNAAEKQLEITSRALKSADQNFRSAQERFTVGSAGIVDFLTANTQLVTARINRINAVYNYLDAQAQLRFALGDL
jgi:outer membrane protein